MFSRYGDALVIFLSFTSTLLTDDSIQEFNSLDPDANIYKLVGPVLLKQDKSEAVMAVEGRLNFIEKEMFVSPSP